MRQPQQAASLSSRIVQTKLELSAIGRGRLFARSPGGVAVDKMTNFELGEPLRSVRSVQMGANLYLCPAHTTS